MKYCNGMQVGDPEELAALDQVFCKRRQTPLLIGSVKSNMGHSEGTAGLCSVAKVVITMEHGLIPPNLHFCTPKQGVEGFLAGSFKVHMALE
jgi:fatty acid synthase